MYSLEQVIYFLEQRQQTEDWNIRDAAIAYLRGYRGILPEYAQMKLDAVNDPLTWDELKQMEGLPVWVEADSGIARWCIVDRIVDLENDILIGFLSRYGYIERSKKMQGIVWNAYKKEKQQNK